MENQVKLDPHGEMLLRQYRELRPTLQQLADEVDKVATIAKHLFSTSSMAKAMPTACWLT